MATQHRTRQRAGIPIPIPARWWLLRRWRLWYIPVLLALLLLPMLLNSALELTGRVQRALSPGTGDIAPLFTAQVQHWEDEIVRWSQEHHVDPNLLATVMQIESCGHPTVASPAGAQGLFQVMPYHFDQGEIYTDPDTNARRGANFLRECSRRADGDSGLAMACYNGGPGVLTRSFHTWAAETRRYYIWGVSIYRDATRFQSESPALKNWLSAGGVNLCSRAAQALGMR